VTADQEPFDHRTLAVALFTRTWELLDQDSRSEEESAEMLTAAFASRHHWRQVGEPRNFSISDWQISRVAAVLGYVRLAADYGQRALEIAVASDLGPFYEGYAHEALARAARLDGDQALVQKHLDLADELLGRVTQVEERDLLGPDLDELRG
jgi:hypothetical protein